MHCNETGNIEYDNTITLGDVTCDSEDHDANVAGFLGLQQKHALFFMKLQFQFLIPDSTVTKLIQELDKFQTEKQTNCKNILQKI